MEKAKCAGCGQNKPTNAAVLNGRFGQYCLDCRAGQTRQASPLSAQNFRDHDRAQHEKDLLQPWDKRGIPNREFIRHYPEEAKLNFTKEELEKYG